MARPRTPSRILELKGSFKDHPSRRRPAEPTDARPLGDPPARLTGEALLFWHELAGMVPPGVLRYSDRWAVEIAARLMYRASCGLITSAEYSVLRSLLGALGLTPSDRTKLSVPVENPASNPFAELAAAAQRFKRPN